MPACRTRWRAASPSLPALAAAPDIVLVADRTEQADRRRRRDLLRRRGVSSGSTASRRRRAASSCRDYFDRLALDRALDSIGDAERRLTAAMVDDRRGRPGGGREPGSSRAQAEVERIRAAMHEIAGTG